MVWRWGCGKGNSEVWQSSTEFKGLWVIKSGATMADGVNTVGDDAEMVWMQSYGGGNMGVHRGLTTLRGLWCKGGVGFVAAA